MIPIPDCSELACLFARAYLRCVATKPKQADVHVTFPDARNSHKRVDEIAQHEQLLVARKGGARP